MATASQAPGVAALPVRHKALLTLGLMLAMMMQILDTTIANVAIPHMQASLGATIDTVSWVLTSYIVASAVAIPITGWLADRIGSRLLLLASVTGFIIASMLCGAAVNLEQMVLFRVLQGIAAAFIGPLTQAAMLDINPPAKQNMAMTVWSMGAVAGPIFGPIIGGWLTESYNWRWVFYVNLPIGLITFALLFAFLPTHPARRRRFDGFGFAMVAIGLASLQLMLDRGEQLDWFDSAEIWIMLGIAVAALWVFTVHMITARDTIVSRSIFANANFVAAFLLIALIGLVVFAVMALMPTMMQGVFGYPVIDAGLLLAPRGVGVLIAMIIASRLITLVDQRAILIIGFAIMAWSLHMMTGWSLDMDSRPIIVASVIQGFGIGLTFVSLNVMAFATLDPKLRAEGASLLNLGRSIGASVGISLGASNLARSIQTSHADLSANITPWTMPPMPAETLGQYEPVGVAALAMVDAEINRQATMIAYLNDFHLMMLATLAAIPLLFLLRKPKEAA
ncbi:MAG: DHA2 family efflux MFS transporter permease subunit [Sphingomonadaceae bacterium]|nr:DHA2 family efflux MFS transporter permease subunit [Sphingomonadaceae bacterium]